MPHQLTLGAAGLLGFLGSHWLFAIAPAALLVALSGSKILDLNRRYAMIGSARVLAISVPAVTAHALLFASLAFAVGRALAFLTA